MYLGPNEPIEELLTEYLDVLDAKQRDVDAIRRMHHNVWKESQVYPIIKQHRSGSRVEKQLRLLQVGKQTDIDYTFEVIGIQVECGVHDSSSIYWQCSPSSNAYGRVFAYGESFKEVIQEMEYYRLLFTEEVFHFDDVEQAFLVHPKSFKENVVSVSGFQYAKARETSKSVKSPSIPGHGSINEYDVVPCLRLRDWPEATDEWCERGRRSDVFDYGWREEIRKTTSLFLVPTGNPTSERSDYEFRLSFSFVEIKCFESLTPKIRKCYGIGKYLFKATLGDDDLLDSYHVKTLMLWIAEEKSTDEWEAISIIEFLGELFGRIDQAIITQDVPHFFVKDCNIFPAHKFSKIKLESYQKKKKGICQEIWNSILQLLRHDLVLRGDFDQKQLVDFGMKSLEGKKSNEPYVNGYLVRLLSVITFSLYENQSQGTLLEAMKRISGIFDDNSKDQQIYRIIPMVNASLKALQVDLNQQPMVIPCPRQLSMQPGDVVSEKAHLAFEAYSRQQFKEAQEIISNTQFESFLPNAFGVSVTSYHKNKIDSQLGFVMAALEKEKNGKAPRFYVDPYLLLHHIQTQLDSLSKPGNSSQLRDRLKTMERIVGRLSDKEPYLGSLSYKFTGVYLLHGYTKYPINENQHKEICLNDITKKYPLGCFNQRIFAGNFDLR